MSKTENSNRRASARRASRQSAAILTAEARRRKGVENMHTIKVDNKLYDAIAKAADAAGTTIDEYVAEWLWSGVDAAKPTLGIPTGR